METDAVQTAVWPEASFAVPVYVVFDAGETDTEPPAVGVEVPTPLSIKKLAALCVVHVSVEEPPGEMDVGEAVSVQTGPPEPGPEVTLTVAAHVTVPPGPVAVPVYVVFAEGETLLVPPETGVTLPIP